MLVTARDQGTAPAQVHFAGTPDEYIAFSQRIVRQGPARGAEQTVAQEPIDGVDWLDENPIDSPLAVMFIGLPVSAVANQIQMPLDIDGLALVQSGSGPSFTMRSLGSALPDRAPSLPVADSLFELQWYKSTVFGPLSIVQLAGIGLVGVLLIALGVVAQKRYPVTASASTAPASTETEKQAAPAEVQPAPSSMIAQDDEVDDLDLPDIELDQKEDLLPDGEVRRGSQPERILDAPELSAGGDEFSAAPGFDPDAPEDDPGLIRMLQSLVEDGKTKPAEAAPSQATVNEVPIEKISIPLPSIFRAYDIRGVVGETLDTEKAYAIGRAIGSEAHDRGLTQIAIARDGRLSGAELLAATARGLQDCGLQVIDVGAVPTPVLYFAANQLSTGSGVMITGSHNPPDYNGFKIMLGGEALSGDAITALHTRLVEKKLHSGAGETNTHRISVQYIERISTDIKLKRKIKVVADCGNGIAGNTAPKLLRAIGADVIPLYAEVDGTFPNHHPDPGDPTTLEDLKLCVRNFNADLGIAFDGDGDRLGVVTASGEIIYPDRLMMLFAQDVLSRNAGAPIIYDVKCSGLLAQAIEDAGGQPIMSRTGHSFIKQRLKAEQAPLAGEMSGHFFFAERWYGFDDGLYAAARLLEILAADERAVGQILSSLPKAESTPELKVEMEEGQPHAFMQAFVDQAQFDEAEINTIDGLRADFEDGWGLVRASNTTPVLVIRFEGQDKPALQRIQGLFREQILAINPDLRLPF
ncbi:MAG: phosphomannomutase/phosphoglucomutase [Pseudomonadota bacterium]